MPGVWSWSGASARRCVSSTVRLDLIFQGVKRRRGVRETAGGCSWLSIPQNGKSHFPGSGGAERRASVSDLQTDIHSIVSGRTDSDLSVFRFMWVVFPAQTSRFKNMCRSEEVGNQESSLGDW